jgi:indolepyruvate ferredoxin oxidoreductase
VLGCDMVVVNDYWALSKIRAGRAHVVLNTYEAMPGTFTTKPDLAFPAKQIVDAVTYALDGEQPDVVDATDLATKLLGDSIASNLFMLGYAWQKGWVPISLDALMRAVELNAAAVEMNKAAFNWGRMAAHDVDLVKAAADGTPMADDGVAAEASPTYIRDAVGAASAATASPLDDSELSRTLDEQIARRVAFLTGYQNAAYANRYKALVEKVRVAEQQKSPGFTSLTEAVARYAFKLMAYKDEYEVARLYTSGEFEKRIRETFDGDYRLHFNLAPPLFARKDAEGHLRKAEYGSWVFGAFRLLAKLKPLRGTALDVFGYTAERKRERALIEDYFRTVETLVASLDHENHALAVEIASLPEQIRGYGHVKERHLAAAELRAEQLMDAWRRPAARDAA